jgi:hypothetical protein
MARVSAAAVARSLRTSAPLTPSTQQVLAAYSPVRLVARSTRPWVRRWMSSRLGSPSAIAWASPFSTARPSMSPGNWRQATSRSGSMPALASSTEKKFLPGAFRSDTAMVLPLRCFRSVTPAGA